MVSSKLRGLLFHLTSTLTTLSPRAGAKCLDALVHHTLGTRLLARIFRRRNLAVVGSVSNFRRILVVADIHIGDAVMLQGAVRAFRDFFPTARIDYAIKESAACLIDGNPDISNLYPIFTGQVHPNTTDVERVRKIAAEHRYDLCLNCCPFLDSRQIFPPGQPAIELVSIAPQLIQNEHRRTGINHFSYQSHMLVHDLLLSRTSPVRTQRFTGVSITLSDTDIAEARLFCRRRSVLEDEPIVVLNPDAASPFTRIPVDHQVSILRALLRLDARVLLGSGFTQKGIQLSILRALPKEMRERVTIIPTTLSLGAYAALCDRADVFLSADTGPLHIAAARKVSKSGTHLFRNRTFVISLFGATPAHMSGYDSSDPLFPAANQNAPSRTYISGSPCRNLTCLNKTAKTCQRLRCFETLDVNSIVADVALYLARRNVRHRSRRFAIVNSRRVPA